MASAAAKPRPPKTNPFDEQWKKAHRTTQRKKLQRASTPSSNSFIDRRIGETNPALDEKSRYLFRLQRERANSTKKHARFSLHDDEDEGDAFFSFENMDEPDLSEDDKGSDVEDPVKGNLKQPVDPFFTVKKLDPDDADEEDVEPRTKREVMHELIQKSKMFKTLRQHQKHEIDDQTTELDEKLPQIMQLLVQSSVETPSQKPKLTLKPAKKDASIFNEDGEGTSTKHEPSHSFQYEDVYKELAQEKRATPAERLLTEEETAQRQKEQLLRLEKLRNDRMRNLDDDDERKKQRAGDDLDDDFDVSSSESEQSEEHSEDESDADERAEHKDHAFLESLLPDKLIAVEGEGRDDIPFAFRKAPWSASDLQSLFQGATVQQRSVVMERLIKCFAISLNPGKNRPKLMRLSEVALQRVEALCGVKKNFAVAAAEIDMLLNHVHALGFEQIASLWGRRHVIECYTKLAEGEGSLCQRWGTHNLLMLRAVGALFPASDARHPVATPLQLLLSEALSVQRMTTLADVVMGVLIGDTLLELLGEAERFSPELGAFVGEVLRGTVGVGPLAHVVEDFGKTEDTLSLSDYAYMISGRGGDNRVTRAKIINAVTCFAEELTFSGRVPNADLVFVRVPIDELEKETAKRMESIVARAQKGRIPLQLYTKTSGKRKFKLRNPRFSAECGVFRKRPRSTFDNMSKGDIQASAKRIRKAMKKEERGLARDVRREAELRTAELAASEKIRREERDVKDKAVRSFFASQQATWRAAEKRQKKLSGKKW